MQFSEIKFNPFFKVFKNFMVDSTFCSPLWPLCSSCRGEVQRSWVWQKVVKIRVNPRNPRIKKARNKANFETPCLTVSTCRRHGYNDFSPKTKNGTKPNKANFQSGKSRSLPGNAVRKTKKMKSKANFFFRGNDN